MTILCVSGVMRQNMTRGHDPSPVIEPDELTIDYEEDGILTTKQAKLIIEMLQDWTK